MHSLIAVLLFLFFSPSSPFLPHQDQQSSNLSSLLISFFLLLIPFFKLHLICWTEICITKEIKHIKNHISGYLKTTVYQDMYYKATLTFSLFQVKNPTDSLYIHQIKLLSFLTASARGLWLIPISNWRSFTLSKSINRYTTELHLQIMLVND